MSLSGLAVFFGAMNHDCHSCGVAWFPCWRPVFVDDLVLSHSFGSTDLHGFLKHGDVHVVGVKDRLQEMPSTCASIAVALFFSCKHVGGN